MESEKGELLLWISYCFHLTSRKFLPLINEEINWCVWVYCLKFHDHSLLGQQTKDGKIHLFCTSLPFFAGNHAFTYLCKHLEQRRVCGGRGRSLAYTAGNSDLPCCADSQCRHHRYDSRMPPTRECQSDRYQHVHCTYRLEERSMEGKQIIKNEVAGFLRCIQTIEIG